MARFGPTQDPEEGSRWLRQVLIALSILALLAGVLTGLYIERGNRQAGQVVQLFTEALQGRQYGEAIGQYRQAQEKALDNGWLARNQDQYKAAVGEMESLTNERLQAIETKLAAQEWLSADDLAFAETMAELSAVRLASFLRQLCSDFLAGHIERAQLDSAFQQIGTLANLQDTIGRLPAEFDRLTAAQEPVKAALASLAEKDYWGAYIALSAVLDHEDWAGFVHEQTLRWLDQCKAEMYDPLLDNARNLMAGGRYLSAKAELDKLAAVFPGDTAIGQALEICQPLVPAELAEYSGPIEIISVKPLIVDPAEAFDGDSYAATAADSMLTTGEFTAMLQQLYANGYMLVDSSRIYTTDRKLAAIQLPPGKKPFVLVIEGLNYYASRRETGNCWGLVLDEGGEVSAEYRDGNGRMVVSRLGESIGILDEFVRLHPDFSLDGAKGTISLTGYECIFGAITDADQLDDRNQALNDNGMPAISLTDTEIAKNRAEVQAVMDRLKMTGWLFASSTYGFIDARSQTLERIQADTEKWLAQVGELTGPVSMLNYPNGAWITGSDERAQWLQNQGFILFTGQGDKAYLYAGNNYIYADKTPINGYSLRNSETYQLGRLFDASKVYDASARP